ncbi:MAG: hypothetical protein QY316_11660 [Thermodesulfobacteriota bacterium]|nr:MAG: hypothetical protein QY316_11660 [Thermodesulfobacteriota bacterium]
MSHRTDSGKRLNVAWGIGAKQALFHKDGKFYERLTQFPGALCDPSGYLFFRTEKEFLECPYLNINVKVNTRITISELPGYISVT